MGTKVEELAGEGRMPGFDGASEWIGSEPLTPTALRGNVVLVQFWTYTCINWLRTLPYIRAWHGKYREHGLVVIGVHTPEFGVEHEIGNVRRAVQEMGVDYPVAVDNDYAIWEAFANRYWPAAYFVDAEGSIRFHRFGEGAYEESEAVIQSLLAQAGHGGFADDLVSVTGQGAEAPADWSSLRSAENYIGYRRAEGLASPGGAAHDVAHAYAVPEELRLDQWALAGDWTVGRESAHSNEPGARIAYRFHARDLHLVMGSDGLAVELQVRVDGDHPGSAHGADIDEEGRGTVSTPRLYQLVRQRDRIEDRTFEITFAEPGIQAYVFTFG